MMPKSKPAKFYDYVGLLCTAFLLAGCKPATTETLFEDLPLIEVPEKHMFEPKEGDCPTVDVIQGEPASNIVDEEGLFTCNGNVLAPSTSLDLLQTETFEQFYREQSDRCYLYRQYDRDYANTTYTQMQQYAKEQRAENHRNRIIVPFAFIGGVLIGSVLVVSTTHAISVD